LSFVKKLQQSKAFILFRLKAYVFCGYPEIEFSTDGEKLYNSAMIIDKEGNAIKSYRKHFLYELDKVFNKSHRPGVLKVLNLALLT
jgi:predicted amidohydrolase